MPKLTPATPDKDPPSKYNGPGYYGYGRQDDNVIWRYFDGENWIGPEVGDRERYWYLRLVKVGVKPEYVQRLLLLLAFLTALGVAILFALIYLIVSRSDGNETVAPATTTAVTQPETPGSAGSEPATVTQPETPGSAGGEPATVTQPETPGSAGGEPATVTQPETPGSTGGEPATVTQPETTPPATSGPRLAIDLSQNYRFVWQWGGDTQGRFDGTISGNAGQWTYTGTSISSWPPRLHVDGGTATCTFQGDPLVDMPQGGWPMNCDLFWDGDATWTGDIRGQFTRLDYSQEGDVAGFEFTGPGNGTDGGDWSPIEILLTPCPIGEVC
jgi:hypothetical protein